MLPISTLLAKRAVEDICSPLPFILVTGFPCFLENKTSTVLILGAQDGVALLTPVYHQQMTQAWPINTCHLLGPKLFQEWHGRPSLWVSRMWMQNFLSHWDYRKDKYSFSLEEPRTITWKKLASIPLANIEENRAQREEETDSRWHG